MTSLGEPPLGRCRDARRGRGAPTPALGLAGGAGNCYLSMLSSAATPTVRPPICAVKLRLLRGAPLACGVRGWTALRNTTRTDHVNVARALFCASRHCVATTLCATMESVVSVLDGPPSSMESRLTPRELDCPCAGGLPTGPGCLCIKAFQASSFFIQNETICLR